jgi:hypothetical protein
MQVVHSALKRTHIERYARRLSSEICLIGMVVRQNSASATISPHYTPEEWPVQTRVDQTLIEIVQEELSVVQVGDCCSVICPWE